MTCEEMIYSNDYADYTINFLQGFEAAEEVYRTGCVNSIENNIAILHMPRKTDYLVNLEDTPYSFIPKLFGLMDSSNMEASGVKAVQNPSKLGLDGKNVVVGVIDTGIDYQNPLFLDENGNSRIGVLWDQTIQGTKKEGTLPEALYGSVFSREKINEAIQSQNPYEVVASKDENGHGTFMAGVAAGRANRENDFIGVAPGAELAVVKLKETKPYLREYFGVPQDVAAYQETDIIYAVEYLIRYANQKKLPISIFIGVGTSNGGHFGQTFLERYLSTILENAGIMVSVPAGNEGNERLHYAGEIKEQEVYQEVEFNVADGQQMLTMEFWGNKPTTFALGLISPQGDRIEQIPPRFGKEEILRLPLAKTTIYVAYQLTETFSGNELIFIRLTNPTPGLWRFLIYAEEARQRTFNIWMPLRQFLRKDTYFLKGEPNNTITAPGNTPLVMTLTAYNHLNNSIYADASRGYNSLQQVKPDLAAPGVDITGPGLRNNFVRRTGTSVAAAHSAGMMALFLQWNIENYEVGIFYAKQIQSLFLKNADRDLEVEYPNPVWGYGRMNIEYVFNAFSVVEYIGREDRLLSILNRNQ